MWRQSALQRASHSYGFSRIRRLAKAEIKEAEAPLTILSDARNPAVNGWAKNPSGKPHKCGWVNIEFGCASSALGPL